MRDANTLHFYVTLKIELNNTTTHKRVFKQAYLVREALIKLLDLIVFFLNKYTISSVKMYE